ncbi:MAG: putative toxin-antitoxin system toxin component, PIN family [candidate division KSB1 bacterium]|nr:putative toxin-antitoxin system toxin component, PIN family [candidate division KSB1 bacterium]MDZ7301920.1 putative toxin-antitoxin system toxin component, PIN family [candidate division KSB1 bacterium]MDZ7314249.1 putative toxin-antitoxin system toxin component, PIN family [candidate division KSB1 bacterium]
MRVVIDTNVFVESLSRASPYHSIFQNLVEGNFFICISNPILLEYEEILYVLHRRENADRLLDFLSFSPFVILVDPTYRFNLIFADPDDNKFVDCAIATTADYIVTRDHHFDVLKSIDFPKVRIIHPDEFIKQCL